MTTTDAAAHGNHEDGEIRITHIRHGELVVLLEAEGDAATQLANAAPDADGVWPAPDQAVRRALLRWLTETHQIGLFNGHIMGSLLEAQDAPFRKPEGSPRELYPLVGSGDPDRGTIQAACVVNLESWLPDPWNVPGNLAEAVVSAARAVRRLNARLRDGGAPQLTDGSGNGLPYKVVGVAPNWLGAGSNACACGGPSDHPVNPRQVDVARRMFQPEDVTRAVNRALRSLAGGFGGVQVVGDGMRGKEITIAVMDSWPLLEGSADQFAALSQKVAELEQVDPPSAERLKRVLKAVRDGGYRDVIGDSAEVGICVHRHGCDGTVDHELNFADHGLFIAGILHEIAPEAKLRVYRAFNQYGCSTAELVSKAVGLAVFDAVHDGNPLVINCSFTVGPETHVVDDLVNADDGTGRWEFAYNHGGEWIGKVGEDRPRIDGRPNHISDAPPAWVQPGGDRRGVDEFQRILRNVTEIDELLVLRRRFAPLWNGKVLPVAAAGNDSCRTGDPAEDSVAPPRFPAAFPEVLGVSAVLPSEPRNPEGGVWRPVEYTNNDDIEISRDDGVSAMGGKPAPRDGDDDLRGMVGPYVSPDLPGGNKFGHALWAGTSFATPVVAALSACVWSELRGQLPQANYDRVTGHDIAGAIVDSRDPNADWTPGDPRRLVRLFQRAV